LASAFEVDEALVAVRAVAVGDVAGEGVVEGVPVQVVGVLDDELADRQEVALDAV
jgi:acetyltransferase-like isoleucine patch superfamily enzyme